MEIVRANKSHIPEISRLFDLYRQFYKCKPDTDLATKFITDRIMNEESVIFVASTEDGLKGFVQLYPSFCSVDAIKIFILYDLYVDRHDRKTGIGALLMNKAAEFSKKEGASRIDLLTEINNKTAQHLYEELGYKKVLEDFYAYSLEI
jgi:ribosomal protein S18 acetylase RimI-like enzyme